MLRGQLSPPPFLHPGSNFLHAFPGALARLSLREGDVFVLLVHMLSALSRVLPPARAPWDPQGLGHPAGLCQARCTSLGFAPYNGRVQAQRATGQESHEGRRWGRGEQWDARSHGAGENPAPQQPLPNQHVHPGDDFSIQ